MEIGSSAPKSAPAAPAPSAPAAPAAPAKTETPSSPGPKDSVKISSEAKTPDSPATGKVPNFNESYGVDKLRSETAEGYKGAAKVFKGGALAADTVEGAAHGAHGLHQAGVHPTGATAKAANVLGKVGPYAGPTAGLLTAGAGAFEAGSALMDPKLSTDQKVNKVAEAATCSAAAWAGGDLGAKGGAVVGAMVAGPPGALVGGAVGGGLGAYGAHKACTSAWETANGPAADPAQFGNVSTFNGAP